LSALHARAFDRPWTEAEMAELLQAAGVQALEAPGGFILIRVVAAEAEVLTVAVAPEERRRGVGRRLLDGALAAAVESGGEAMFLEVAADNRPALALYDGAGFVRVGVRRGYYARPCGQAVDALTLRRALNRSGS
jgi:ribosomal-protein-alanine N-acetyltransferase